MPELPEVETIVKQLNNRALKVLGARFLDVWTDSPKLVKKPLLRSAKSGATEGQAKSFKEFKKQIKGKKILRVWRRAKNIIVDLSGSYSLLIHQKMTGHLLIGKWKEKNGKWEPLIKGFLEEKANRYIRVMFWLNGDLMLALSDLRKFAKIELWKTDDLLNSKDLLNLGPEPLEKSFTFEKFKNIFKDKKGRIKQILMNQEIIAGIGNIYSDETLWRSRIHPLKEISSLKEKELMIIYENIKKVLTKAIKLNGESFSDFRDLEGRKGNFDTERKVYRREGEKCSRCGTIIKRLKIGGRSACYCPKCQEL